MTDEMFRESRPPLIFLRRSEILEFRLPKKCFSAFADNRLVLNSLTILIDNTFFYVVADSKDITSNLQNVNALIVSMFLVTIYASMQQILRQNHLTIILFPSDQRETEFRNLYRTVTVKSKL